MKISIIDTIQEYLWKNIEVGNCFMTPHSDAVYLKLNDSCTAVNSLNIDELHLLTFSMDELVVPVEAELKITKI